MLIDFINKKMNKVRAVHRKELTAYEQSIVDKIDSRISFLDFIKNGIKFYGYEKYQDEIKALKIERSYDLEPLIRIPYNLNDNNKINHELINSIIEICIYLYGDISKEDVFSHKYRSQITQLRQVIFNLLHKYAKMSPTEIGRLFGRSRQVIHNGFHQLYQSLHLKKHRDVNFNEMFIKMNKAVCKKLTLKNAFVNIPEDATIYYKNGKKIKTRKFHQI